MNMKGYIIQISSIIVAMVVVFLVFLFIIIGIMESFKKSIIDSNYPHKYPKAREVKSVTNYDKGKVDEFSKYLVDLADRIDGK